MDQEPEPLEQLSLELLEPHPALQDMDKELQPPLELLELLELHQLDLQELLHMANNKELPMEQAVQLEHQELPLDMEHQEQPLDMDQDQELHMDNQPPAVFPHQDKDTNHHTKEPQVHQVLTPQVPDHQADHHQDTASRPRNIEI